MSHLADCWLYVIITVHYKFFLQNYYVSTLFSIFYSFIEAIVCSITPKNIGLLFLPIGSLHYIFDYDIHVQHYIRYSSHQSL